jgi:hypothetical protein
MIFGVRCNCFHAQIPETAITAMAKNATCLTNSRHGEAGKLRCYLSSVMTLVRVVCC